MSAIYYVIAFAAGPGITLQTTLNSQLAKGLGGDPVTAALSSFTAGRSASEFTRCCVEGCSSSLRLSLRSLYGAWRAG
ncbi:uncharacterized membrane protein YdcZ (DUF606 family) [Pantoea anthophila]|nr:uncharacterized membrane protein YdcZ (DUF606 family) [Pantoea anthophila]